MYIYTYIGHAMLREWVKNVLQNRCFKVTCSNEMVHVKVQGIYNIIKG